MNSPKKKQPPAFNIVLAPAGVSILAMITTSKALLKYNVLDFSFLFSDISKIYSVLMFGYGLWVSFGLISLYYRIIKEKEKIPFSELWWAFIFPTGAFTLATVNLYSFIVSFLFVKILYYLLYFILLIIWFYVLLKQFLVYYNSKKEKINR